MGNRGIAEAARAVLIDAAVGKRQRPHVLTNYHSSTGSLERLRDAVVAEYGEYGRGADKHYTLATPMANMVSGLQEVEVEFLDAAGLCSAKSQRRERSGFLVIGMWRLKR